MPFDLTSHQFVLTQARYIYDRVLGRDGLMYRPDFGTKAIAGRLKTGIRALAAFLRRILILIALEMEPSLVHIDRPENLARSKGKKFRPPSPARFIIYPDKFQPQLPAWFDPSPWDQSHYKAPMVREPHTTVPLSQLFSQLDHLRDIAKDPIAKARKLAFYLARSRHGIILPPPDNNVTMRRWGLEPSALYDAMGFRISYDSAIRPPPLPPRWRGSHPTITLL